MLKLKNNPTLWEQRGAIQFIALLILLAGIIAGVYLVQQTQIFKPKATNPHIEFKSSTGQALPTDDQGIPQSTSATLMIELTSTLGPPIPSVSSPILPPTIGTVSYKIAENPTDLTNAPDQPYTEEPTIIDYTFKDQSLGSKFIWAEFKDDTGHTDIISGQVDLVALLPPCEIYGDLNLDGKVDSTDVDLASKVASGVIVPSISQTGDTQHMSKVGDVNDDNKVDTTDVSLIQGYVNGSTATFPVCTSAKASPCGTLGDVTTNGNITPMDAYEALRIVSGFPNSLYTKQPFTDDQKERADVDGDNQVSSIDSLRILRYLKGFVSTFTACPAQPSPG